MADRDELDWKGNNAKSSKQTITVSKPVIDKETWFNEVKTIKGIGDETAKDIVKIYPTKDALLAALSSGEHVPLVNKHVEILREHYTEA